MKPTESRKNNKPIMEKRRRARINQCLNELKTLILEALRKDPSRHSKLEKADILEMTVKYLENLQRQQLALSMATNPQIMSKYRAGFGECVAEVSRFLAASPTVDATMQQRLLSHLTDNLNGLEDNMAALTTSEFRRQYRGLQLIPTRFPGGEVLFFLPSNSSPLSVRVSTEDKTQADPDVAQDLSTNLSISSGASSGQSPRTAPEDDDDDMDSGESATSGDPWRPW